MVRAGLILVVPLLGMLSACDFRGGDADAVSKASEAPPLSKREAGDIAFANRMIMARYADENRRRPKLGPETAIGDWFIAAAVRPVAIQTGNAPATRFDPQPQWDGSKVSITSAMIQLTPANTRLIAPDPALGVPLAHPRCTRPEFDADLSDAAGELTDAVDPYLDFALPAPQRGRYYGLTCHGGKRDANGMSIEDSAGPFSLFVYDENRIILQWGALEFLLRRTIVEPKKSR